MSSHYTGFRGKSYWMIITQDAWGIEQKCNVNFLRQDSKHMFPKSKVNEETSMMISRYLIKKLKKREDDGSFAILFSREAGGWQCNWIKAKIYKWLLRRIIDFDQSRITIANIVSIQKQFVYSWWDDRRELCVKGPKFIIPSRIINYPN